MEQVLFRLHVRFITTTCNIIKPRARNVCEKLILLIAIVSLSITTLLHFSYVSPLDGHSNCLVHALNLADNNNNNNQYSFNNEYAEILNIHITTNNTLPNLSLLNNSNKVLYFIFQSVSQLKFGDLYNFSSSTFNKIHQWNATTIQSWLISNSSGNTTDIDPITIRKYQFSLEKGYLLLPSQALALHNITQSDVYISTESTCFGQHHYYYPVLSSLLLRSLIGYDTVTKNWIIRGFGGRGYLYNTHAQDMYDLNLAADFVARTGNAGGTGIITTRSGGSAVSSSTSHINGTRNSDSGRKITATTSVKKGSSGKGDIVNVVGKDICNSKNNSATTCAINNSTHTNSAKPEPPTTTTGGGGVWQHYIAFKVGVLITTLFLFFTTTTLVSFTLRVTQERMLKFTFLLNYNISNRIPIAAIVVTHVVETLVFVPLMIGLLFFLIEFFLDQFLAFLVLSLVWLAEVFSLVSLRSQTSLRHFPAVFFCYFCLFHIYFFCFPFGFAYPALLTTVLFLSHAMMCFWNYCEIPAFEAGLVTALHPRFGSAEITTTADTAGVEIGNATSSSSSSSSSSSVGEGQQQQQQTRQQYARSLSEPSAYNSNYDCLNDNNNNTNDNNQEPSPYRSSSSSSSSFTSQRRQFLSHHTSPTHPAALEHRQQQQPQPFQSRFHFTSISSSMGSSQHSDHSENNRTGDTSSSGSGKNNNNRTSHTRPSSLSQPPQPLTLPFPLTPVRRPTFHRPSIRRVTGAPPPTQPPPPSLPSSSSGLHHSSSSSSSNNNPHPPPAYDRVLSPGVSQREMTYSRHVELSRRVQDQQMAAILLGMNNTNTNANSTTSSNNTGTMLMMNASSSGSVGNSVLSTSLMSLPLPSLGPLMLRVAPAVYSRQSTSSSAAADIGLDLDSYYNNNNNNDNRNNNNNNNSNTHSRSNTITSSSNDSISSNSPAQSPTRPPALRRSLSSLTGAMRALERDGSSADLQSQNLFYM